VLLESNAFSLKLFSYEVLLESNALKSKMLLEINVFSLKLFSCEVLLE
jgi:hypothetical protein